MGSPLSPIIADIVMHDLEKTVLDSPGLEIKFYYRYVDNIIISAQKKYISHILDMFNNYERLKFTMKTMNSNTINFLDLNIMIDDKSLTFDFHKNRLQREFYHFSLTILHVTKSVQ